jgi:hypothetical protein
MYVEFGSFFKLASTICINDLDAKGFECVRT